MTGPGLTGISTEDLRRLMEAIEQGCIAGMLTPTQLTANALGHLAPNAGLLLGLEAQVALAVLRAVMAEREADRPPEPRLVWTGPDATVSESRYTAVVVEELFQRARKSVLIGGYAFDHGEELFKPLHQVMVDHGVTVEFFVDIKQMDTSLHRWARATHRDMHERLELVENARKTGPGEYAHEIISWFLDAQWPFDGSKPTVYYDPRTAEEGTYASLHAKCLVVDNRHALITSANFTDRGQTRNIEAGVLIEGPFALTLASQWRRLVDAGMVERYSG